MARLDVGQHVVCFAHDRHSRKYSRLRVINCRFGEETLSSLSLNDKCPPISDALQG
jgi:hypothetical protein